jgi:hypothetical protein
MHIASLDSDAAGLFDIDSLPGQADLHRLFEGAEVVSEVDDFDDEEPVDFDD